MAEEQETPPSTWTKEVSSVVEIPAGLKDKRITTYYADAAAVPPEHKRIAISGTRTDGTAFTFDYPRSELGMSPEEDAMLDAAGNAVLARIMVKEGFGT